MSSYKKVYDGDLIKTGQLCKWMCCNCGLVHTVKFEFTGKHDLRMWRDNRATAARRRRGKKK